MARRDYRRGCAQLCSLSLVLLGSCTLEQLELQVEGDLAEESLALLDYFPHDGSLGIGRDIQPLLAFNRTPRDEELAGLGEALAYDSETHEVYSGPLVLAEQHAVVRVELPPLDPDRSYRLYSPVPSGAGDTALSADFETRLPGGSAFNMSTGLQIEDFGANPSHAELMQGIIQPGEWPLWVLILEGWPTTAVGDSPVPVSFSFAPGRIEADVLRPYIVHWQYGFVSRFVSVEVEPQGWFEHEQAGLFLPLWSGEDVITLYLEEVRLTGRLRMLDGEVRVESYRLEGVVGAIWLLALASYGGGWEVAVDLMELDVDTDGNGLPDAASFCFSSTPSPIEVSEIDF